ncbi:hypothetical protein BJ138DRAFT_1223769 [Hygrophoropsis aurantiaca]|uniref:Uncharacterized protein n=1 Tax=Hygrophoropsis aurantiaca TaxID=72124 RepID=A0ACB7ZYL2_9AGAM|nr:hypothetical protein BJ138DRAFT_1223769 [Hygrophoropsis aurantiaca]
MTTDRDSRTVLFKFDTETRGTVSVSWVPGSKAQMGTPRWFTASRSTITQGKRTEEGHRPFCQLEPPRYKMRTLCVMSGGFLIDLVKWFIGVYSRSHNHGRPNPHYAGEAEFQAHMNAEVRVQMSWLTTLLDACAGKERTENTRIGNRPKLRRWSPRPNLMTALGPPRYSKDDGGDDDRVGNSDKIISITDQRAWSSAHTPGPQSFR